VIYSRDEFAAELERILIRGRNLDCVGIASWAYETRLKHLGAIDTSVSNWLLQLGAMDMGTEFELTMDDLRKIVAEAREH
jgi:hypothetical protein